MEETEKLSRRKLKHGDTVLLNFTLPDDLIPEILSRVSVKSLLRFRCVSKSWCSLISSKSFAKTHLENSTKNKNLTHHNIIMTTTFKKYNYSIHHCSLHSVLYGSYTHTDESHSDYPVINYNENHPITVVGCCNGLCCIIVDGAEFYLWNPSTKKFNKLPSLRDGTMKGDLYILNYGFGFDESIDNFKVFARLSFCSNEDSYQFVIKIYSLKTNSWKSIGEFKDHPWYLDDSLGMFVNGKLHWCRNKRVENSGGWDIVSFDLRNEVQEIIELPNSIEACDFQSLAVLGGYLSVACTDQVKTEVWILKDYGVKESWVKFACFPYTSISPLWIAQEGDIFDILLCDKSDFLVYNPIDKWSIHPQVSKMGLLLEAKVYIQSLISLFFDRDEGESGIDCLVWPVRNSS